MEKNDQSFFKVVFPSWVIFLATIAAIGFFVLSFSCIILGKYDDLPLFEFWKPIIFFIITFGVSFFVVYISHYCISATKNGIENHPLIGHSKFFAWDEIVEVRRPLFHIPVDFNYVVSKNGKRLLLIRSMNNYKELIQLIEQKAHNLQKCQI